MDMVGLRLWSIIIIQKSNTLLLDKVCILLFFTILSSRPLFDYEHRYFDVIDVRP